MGRTTLSKGPFLNVYLNLRLLFRDDTRDPRTSKLKVLSNGVSLVPKDSKLGIPRIN